MSFLQHMNFSRSVILVSFVGSAVLGYFVWQKKVEVDIYSKTIAAKDMEVGVHSNVAKARELDELMAAASGGNFGSSASDLEQYIITAALNPKVKIGKIDIGKPDEDEIVDGLIDVKFSVKPSRSGNDSFQLSSISNFAFELEQGHPLVKVTRLKIGLPEKVKEHEVLSNRWKFELEARVRIKEDA